MGESFRRQNGGGDEHHQAEVEKGIGLPEQVGADRPSGPTERGRHEPEG